MTTNDADIIRAKEPTEAPADYAISDPYAEWIEREGVPLIVDFAFDDLNTLELGTWERKGGKGAIINIPNDEIPNDAQVVEIEAGSKSEPEHHMYETQIYVLSGRGATSIWNNEKEKATFEWHAGSLFAIPLNAWYQFFNGSGTESARYIAVTSAPPIMRLYRNDDFVFNNPYVFSERLSDQEEAFNGTGKLYNKRVWETNFIPNAPDMPLYGWKERGAGGVNAMLEMAKNSINSRLSEFPLGTYKKAAELDEGDSRVQMNAALAAFAAGDEDAFGEHVFNCIDLGAEEAVTQLTASVALTAKAISLVHNTPLIAVNHLEGHALSPRLSDPDLGFPYLLLLVSGGHCQLLAVEGPGAYCLYGATLDDAVGEAFDKTAKLLGLPYPGGPAIEDAARRGREDRFAFPRPMRGRKGCEFSFSGLKTAVARTIHALADPAADTADTSSTDHAWPA